jgi:hypothetical protein
MEQTIKSYNELTNFITSSNLTPKQAVELISVSLKVWIIKEYDTTAELISDLNVWWAKYEHTNDKPIFIEPFDISQIYNDNRTEFPKRYF